jgi:hypothetical protein
LLAGCILYTNLRLFYAWTAYAPFLTSYELAFEDTESGSDSDAQKTKIKADPFHKYKAGSKSSSVNAYVNQESSRLSVINKHKTNRDRDRGELSFLV